MSLLTLFSLSCSKFPLFVVLEWMLFGTFLDQCNMPLSDDVTRKLLCAFVLWILHCRNSLLAGCPKYLLRTPRSAGITPLLHWLPVEQKIEYKLSLFCFEIITYHLSGPHLPLRPSSPLHSFAAWSFCRHPKLQNTKCFQTRSSGQCSFSCQAPTVWNQHVSSVSSLSVLSELAWEPFSFYKPFLESHCSEMCVCACVCVFESLICVNN